MVNRIFERKKPFNMGVQWKMLALKSSLQNQIISFALNAIKSFKKSYGYECFIFLKFIVLKVQL